MANRTVKDAKSVRGTNPQFLIEKIIRSRIYECKYWKEECFALSAELIVDKAMELRFLGGVYGGNIKPTPFLCLTLKMLQIQPEKDIIVEFIKNEEFKYVRALGAMYMRLVGTSIECYKYLEPLLNDGRKLRYQTRDGAFMMVHVDEYIDQLLHEERMYDIILPRIQKRHVLEEANEVEPRISALDDDADDNVDSSGDEDDLPPEKPPRRDERKRASSPVAVRPKERERSKERDRKHRERERDRDPRDKGRERDREREKARPRSRSRERRHRSRSQERRPERERPRERLREERERPREERERPREERPREERPREERERPKEERNRPDRREDKKREHERHDREYEKYERDQEKYEREHEKYDREYDKYEREHEKYERDYDRRRDRDRDRGVANFYG